ncbi:hypothetical protein ACQ4PT_027709 [Festuca glaucescens]
MQAGASEERNRGSRSAMEKGSRDQSAKKPRLDLEALPSVPVKQEIVVHQAAGAIVPVEHVARTEIDLRMDVPVLHCPICFRQAQAAGVPGACSSFCFTVRFDSITACSAGAQCSRRCADLISWIRTQCMGGHAACHGCLAGGCGMCDGAAFVIPNTAMDGVVSSARARNIYCVTKDDIGRFEEE